MKAIGKIYGEFNEEKVHKGKLTYINSLLF